MTPLHIVIDARRLQDFGIGTYIRSLVRALGSIDTTNRYTLVSAPGVNDDVKRRHFSVGLWGRPPGGAGGLCRRSNTLDLSPGSAGGLCRRSNTLDPSPGSAGGLCRRFAFAEEWQWSIAPKTPAPRPPALPVGSSCARFSV